MAFTTTDQHASAESAMRVEWADIRPLYGMKAISAYMGKSEGTILKYITTEGLPAAKIGGSWFSDEGRIDAWRMQRIA